MIHIFIGTKAQLIKMAPIMSLLQKRNIEYNFIFSGQHRETIDDLRRNFDLKDPDVTLYSGKDITSVLQMLIWSLRIIFKCLRNKSAIWKGDKNGIVLNHGDTFSTLLGTLLAKLSGLKSAHIESGLRSFNLLHPFPEEVTRLLVFKLSDYYFCPGDWAKQNLVKYKGIKINTEANTLFDSLNIIAKQATPKSLDIPEKDYAVVTLHRFENLFKQAHLDNIIRLLEQVSAEIHLIFILHKPTVKKLEQYGLLDRLKNNPSIELRPRYDYSNFIHLVKQAKFVISDGGSNQEECAYIGKPCLLFRNATERQEGLGHNTLLSMFREDKIMEFVKNYKNYESPSMELAKSPSQLIVETIESYQ